jgi:glycine/D-amino acid oxidase-like deaminating enzyme
MAQTADVVVIGGGINGCSIAYRLARNGAGNVVLIEKGHIASGPTGRSSGIVRQHYTIETLAAMARDSVRVFQNFAELVGGHAGFVQAGVVFTSGQADATSLQAVVEMHRRLGIRESLLSLAGGCYEPDGGYADPALTAKSFSEAAARDGATLMRRTRVTGLQTQAGRIAGVVTDKGEIATRTVVNAGGPWGAEIAAMAGAEIPIYVTRHPVVILRRPVAWRTKTPVWLDLAEGWYFKPEGQVGLMAGSIHNMGEDQGVSIETYSTVPTYQEDREIRGSHAGALPGNGGGHGAGRLGQPLRHDSGFAASD